MMDVDNPSSELNNLSPVVAAVVSVLLSVFITVGVLGNSLTVAALVGSPRIRGTVTAVFIISLCVADFLFCVLVLPFEASRFMLRRWVWGDGLICTIIPLLRYWNVAASLLSIAMITINRFILIAHYKSYRAVYRTLWTTVMVAFCWLLPLAMLLPTLLGSWGRFGLDQRLGTCTILSIDGVSSKEPLFIIGFCVPATVIVVCYSLIFYTFKRSHRRMMIHNGADNSAPASTKKKVQEWRMTIMVLTVFIAFLVTYLPITLVKAFDGGLQYPGLHLLGYVLIYMSCCINPIIYVIMNRQYRRAYRSLLCSSCHSRAVYSCTGVGTSHQQQYSGGALKNPHSVVAVTVLNHSCTLTGSADQQPCRKA